MPPPADPGAAPDGPAAPGRAVLLRGVNVGTAGRLAMADLRAALRAAGADSVRTYLASGNAVIRDAGEVAAQQLAQRLETLLADRHGLRTTVLHRSAAELAQVVADNPFPDAVGEPGRLHAVFLAERTEPAALHRVGDVHGPDRWSWRPGVLYLRFTGASHSSPLQPALRRLAVVGTARTWASVTALAALTDALPD